MSDTTDDLTKPATSAPTVDDFAEDFGGFDEFDPPPAPQQATAAPRGRRPAQQPAQQQQQDDLPEGFETTIRVKAPKARAPKQEEARIDPLAWLSDARVGTIRITRRAGNGVNGEGKATRGLFKGKYVGIGECGILDITSPEDVLEQIRNRWGGGNYQITHLDGQGQPARAPVPLAIPQDPKPVEEATEGDQEDEDDAEDDDREVRPHGYPGLPGYDPRLDPRWAEERDHVGPGRPRVWRPSYEDEQAREEEKGVMALLAEEREKRLALEAQIEREKLAGAHAKEMAELRALVATAAQRPTGKDPVEMFMAMMAEQNRQAQERYEREARERRERDEREARERKEQLERERRDREAERQRQDALAAQAAAQNQQFMQMVLGQKQNPTELLNLVVPMLKDMIPKHEPSQPLQALDQAFAIVERARDIAQPEAAGGGDEDEGGLAGMIRAATPVLKPAAEAVVRAMSRPEPQPPPRRVNVQHPPMPAAQPPALPAPAATTQAPAAQPPVAPAPKQKTTDEVIAQVAKIVGVVANAWQSKQEPDKVAAALVGYAAGIDASEEVEQIAASDLRQIHSQLTLVKNMGLTDEAAAQIDAFLAIYSQPGGQQWLAQVLSALGSDDESEAAEA